MTNPESLLVAGPGPFFTLITPITQREISLNLRTDGNRHLLISRCAEKFIRCGFDITDQRGRNLMILDIKKTDFATGRTQRLNALLLVFSGKQRSNIQNRYLGEIKTS